MEFSGCCTIPVEDFPEQGQVAIMEGNIGKRPRQPAGVRRRSRGIYPGSPEGMKSSETISASDYLFFRNKWQHFCKKRHPVFRELPFHPLISDLMPFPLPEKILFSNDTRDDRFRHGHQHVRKPGLEKGPWQPKESHPGE
jgi:hypothetical protein